MITPILLMAVGATLLNVALLYRLPWFAIASGLVFAFAIAKAGP